MKTIIITSIFVSLILGFIPTEVIAQNQTEKPISQSENKKYVCPMHPEVIRDKPGKCPICGMNLQHEQHQQQGDYYCPMHPDYISKESGRCPKCGMNLKKRVREGN